MDSGTASYSTVQRRPARPLDDSSEEENVATLPMGVDQVDTKEVVDEDTTTTTTTTTTTAKLHKKHLSGRKHRLDGLVARHQAVHQKFAAQPSIKNGAEIVDGNQVETIVSAGDKTLDKQTVETIQQTDVTTLRSPSAPSGTLPHKPGQSTEGSPITAHPLRTEASKLLSSSSSSSSLTSTASTNGPGTPSSVDGYTITTSTVTTKKRKVRRPTFEPRTSPLDPETMSQKQDSFHGFHTLFWITMGAYGVITLDSEWTRIGSVFSGMLFSSFSQDAIMLFFSDVTLVVSTAFSLLLVKAIAKGWIRYKVTGMVIQHTLQALFLFLAIAWAIFRDWPWVQSGFFTLHALTMLMKIHSYIAFNGELSEKLIQLRKLEDSYAYLKKHDIVTIEDNDGDVNSFSSSIDARQGAAGNEETRQRDAIKAAALLLRDPASNSAPTISIIASEIDELKSELRCQNGELWPANVIVANYVDYLIIPTLIYELQYPRTTSIRPMYVFEKVVATMGTFSLLYLTTENYIYPVVFDPAIPPARALVLLLIPFMMNYIMIFFIIFECICNAFAELSRFADRNFYDDWWNSVGFDEWARKWNKPVHNFLLRHVYDSSIESFHLSKANAAFATYFLSSCVHEMVMMIVTRKVRMYLFVLQMFQLPLIWAGQNKHIRERPRLANALFWIGMFGGPPLLGVAYCYA
ncbi:hypothetical protein BGZ99_000786 [Dissophora globulifera]|uniref:O-acyltransferase n=1 Tax=Dissophora globulifera TaxID=979702 RepID=A0A9P6RPD6_9FUNG|nr:hypothetical protein BGZ99_000786 [Dissophora globulifera]